MLKCFCSRPFYFEEKKRTNKKNKTVQCTLSQMKAAENTAFMISLCEILLKLIVFLFVPEMLTFRGQNSSTGRDKLDGKVGFM